MVAEPGSARLHRHPAPEQPPVRRRPAVQRRQLPRRLLLLSRRCSNISTPSYGDPSGGDPFVFTGSRSSRDRPAPTPVTRRSRPSRRYEPISRDFKVDNNYNFAIARVRLRGSRGPKHKAEGVKVFFRMWGTQTADTDWNPGYTYLSHDDSAAATRCGRKRRPTVTRCRSSPPATRRTSAIRRTPSTARAASTAGTIEIQQGDEQWTYFGCFLNLYDASFSVNGQTDPGTAPGRPPLPRRTDRLCRRPDPERQRGHHVPGNQRPCWRSATFR